MVVRDKAQQGEAKSGHTCSTQDREFSGELNDRSANANWSFKPFFVYVYLRQSITGEQ